MLAFDKEAVSERTEDQLQKLHEDTVLRIKEIESATDFPRNVTGLCAYCGFRSICPSFMHEIEIEDLPVEQFKDDDGVRMVDEYQELEAKSNEIRAKMDEIKEKLVAFSNQKGIDMVYGSNRKARVKEDISIRYPDDKDAFENLLRQKGIYDDVSGIIWQRLTSKIKKNQLDDEIIDKVTKDKCWKVSFSKRKEDDQV
jgi:hypothetical protein